MKSLVYDTPGESEQSLIARIVVAADQTTLGRLLESIAHYLIDVGHALQ